MDQINEVLSIQDELNLSLPLVYDSVYKNYLKVLDKCPVAKPSETLHIARVQDTIRMLHLKKLVTRKGEDIFQKLTTVYNAAAALGVNLIVMFDSEEDDKETNIYIGLKAHDLDDRTGDLAASYQTLCGAINGNFQGSDYKKLGVSNNEIQDKLNAIFEKPQGISSVSCVVGERKKDNTVDKKFIQGLEKFVDAMQEKAYTAVFIAELIPPETVANIRNDFEKLHTALYPLSKLSWSYQESDAVTESTTVTNTTTISLNHSRSHADTEGVTNSIGAGLNGNVALNLVSSLSNMIGQSVGVNGGGVGAVAGGLIGTFVCPGLGTAGGATIGNLLGSTFSAGLSASEAITNSIGATMGLGANVQAGRARSKSSTDTKTTGGGISQARAVSVTKGTTRTDGKSLQVTYNNKTIEEMLKKIDESLIRCRAAEDYGGYSCAAYFISSREKAEAVLAANTYRSLMIGDGTSTETCAVNSWSISDDKEKFNCIKEYLSKFEHPIFYYGNSPCTAGSLVTGKELPYHLGLPIHSVYGLPVLRYTEFGKEVFTYDNYQGEGKKVKIGKVFNMSHEDLAEVDLDIESLSMHTFITGSTGSGKSNTVYNIINQLSENDIKYMIIEPAKGEYRHVFSNEAIVLGTNPNMGEILKINPFMFPEDIHVFEHVDRLVELFNVCWPMYAAMPAVLKDSIIRAYEECGWDIETSYNEYNFYPTFLDVLYCINKVIKSSAYSSDTKGDYIGSLSTRIKSLTNGINGIIFSGNETDSAVLFDNNVIIDLSRVSSTETKSLIMGILVMRLNEYRMANVKGMNEPLKHVTVLEEAHNLLKRISTEQSMEGSNLAGKSVEMLSNSIAEMRTYGEGFIIVDQSPNAVDISAIRNTNTKIIMRLPEVNDRNDIGKSVALNDDQIDEISRLPKGVAVIYQNNWLSAVQSKVNKFEYDLKMYTPKKVEYKKKERKYEKEIVEILLENVINNNRPIDIYEFYFSLMYIPISSAAKYDAIKAYHYESNDIKSIQRVIYEIFTNDRMIEIAQNLPSYLEWNSFWLNNNIDICSNMDKFMCYTILQCIIQEMISRGYEDVEALDRWHELTGGPR